MGSVGSTIYNQGRRIILRYNVENRTYKFLDKGNLPPAPKHETTKRLEVPPLSREVLEDIHCKNPQLDEYLKKVYLTSTSVITGTPSTRPKPKKENEVLKKYMFYEPEIPETGKITLSNAVLILMKYQTDSENWSTMLISEKYKLKKEDVVNLITYYSLFRREDFEFLQQKACEKEKIEFEEFTDLVKKPVRQIQSK